MTSTTKHDKPLLGVFLMLGFCFVAPMGDATAKLLGDRVPLVQVLLWRFGLQACLLIPLVALTGRIWRMHGTVLWLTALRTVLRILGIGMMFSALRYLPLADAVAIAFVMPFIMLLLGHVVLGEEVGWRRLIACLVGFIGTLLVVQPSFQEVGWPALLPIGVAVNFSVFMLVTRQIAKKTDPIGLQAVSGVMAVFIILPILVFVPAGTTPGVGWIAADAPSLGLLVAIGALGTLAGAGVGYAIGGGGGAIVGGVAGGLTRPEQAGEARDEGGHRRVLDDIARSHRRSCFFSSRSLACDPRHGRMTPTDLCGENPTLFRRAHMDTILYLNNFSGY